MYIHFHIKSLYDFDLSLWAVRAINHAYSQRGAHVKIMNEPASEFHHKTVWKPSNIEFVIT